MDVIPAYTALPKAILLVIHSAKHGIRINVEVTNADVPFLLVYDILTYIESMSLFREIVEPPVPLSHRTIITQTLTIWINKYTYFLFTIFKISIINFQSITQALHSFWKVWCITTK